MSIEQMNSTTLQALGILCAAMVVLAGVSVVSTWIATDFWYAGVRAFVFGAGTLALVLNATLLHDVRVEVERRRGLHPAQLRSPSS